MDEHYDSKAKIALPLTSRHSKNIGKICYILLHIPVPSETFVINEILALQSLGVDILPISLWSSQICHEEMMAQIKNPVYSLSDYAVQQQASDSYLYGDACRIAASFDISSALAARAAVAAEYVLDCSINLIHAHFATEAALVALLVSKITGIPYSFTAHAYDIFMPNVAGETHPDRRIKLLAENAAKAITISEFNLKHLLSITGPSIAEKLHVVHCGIDLNRFKIVERRTSDSVTFLSVGRLISKKGHDLLLRSFKIITDICDAQLRIVGEGEMLSSLMLLADDLEISDKVTFVGALSSDRVLKEMQNADVFVLHSLTGKDGNKEGIPVSIMEACATGLPVVSTRHAGIPELIVEGVSGFLVDERDCNGFAEAMRSLAISPTLRSEMGIAGRSKVVEHFDLFKEAQKLKNIFETIVEHSLSAPANIAPRNQIGDNTIPPIFGFESLKLAAKGLIKRLLR